MSAGQVRVVRMTLSTAKLFTVLLEEPRGAHYGLALMDSTGLPSGTIYPLLAKLVRNGYLEQNWEMVNPSEAGRPRRRFYSLTANGAETVARQMMELHSNLRSPQTANVAHAGGLTNGNY